MQIGIELQFKSIWHNEIWKWNVLRLLICFLDIKGIIQYESFPLKQTMNHAYYLQVLNCLWQHIKKKDQIFNRISGVVFGKVILEKQI
jgi:hypothetical protein